MIELIVLDVDGTLTNGKITYSSLKNNPNGIFESKSFDVKDGMAIASWTKKYNKKVAIITGRNSKIVEQRAKELGIEYLYQGVDNKDEILETILKTENLTWENVAAMGDDLNDYKMLKKVGLSFAVNDAVDEIKEIVHIVCCNNGGDGAAREMIEFILDKDSNKKLIDLWV